MKRFRKLAFFVAIAILVFLVRAATSPVIFRFKEPGPVDPADGLHVVFSPLRNRDPELAANKFLQSLEQEHCGTGITKVAEPYCERENKHRLTGWLLVDRAQNRDGTVLLHYKVFRSDYDSGAWGNVWIRSKSGPNGWETVNFDTYY